MILHISKLFIILISVIIYLNDAWAADHRNLESGFPTRIEDAYPISFRSLEFQTKSEYEREGDHGTNAVKIIPELKWGLIKNAHVALATPLLFSESRKGQQNGDVELEGLYNFNVETQSLPAFAFKGGVRIPSGVGSNKTNYELLGIVTRGFGEHRFHLNIGYERKNQRESGENSDNYTFGLGFDTPINLDTLFTADFLGEAPHDKSDPLATFIIGARKQINPWSVLNFGIGSGFGGADTPDFISTLGFQINF